MKQVADETRGFAPTRSDMSAEDFERFGHAVVDWINRYFAGIEQRPVLAD